MRRALGGLLLNSRRAMADTSTHHHRRRRHHGFCMSSAFAQALPSFEHPHGQGMHDCSDNHHAYRHDQPHGLWQAASGLQFQQLHFHQQHQLMSPALGSIRHDFPQTRLCNTSAFAATPIDPDVVALACPMPVDPHVSSTLQGPIQPARIHNAKTVENFSHDAARHDLSTEEAHKLLKLIKIEDFKKRLANVGKHCMPLEEFLKLCKQTGTATSDTDAEEVAKTLDEAGFILIFRKKVFLEPEKVAEVISRAIPLPLALEDDPRNQEYARLKKEKDEIDQIAHKQVRNMLWGAFGALSAQSMLFFRLTFWELSWDVMEPIAFFVTSSGLLAGFFFFVITKRDPSYHDFMDMLFSSKQRKLIKKRNFDFKRFKELQIMCCLPSSQSSSMQLHSSPAC